MLSFEALLVVMISVSFAVEQSFLCCCWGKLLCQINSFALTKFLRASKISSRDGKEYFSSIEQFSAEINTHKKTAPVKGAVLIFSGYQKLFQNL